MNITSKRNNKVKQILDSFYENALNENLPIDETDYKEPLDELFDTHVWGFREILLVVIIGMKLDTEYKPSTALYDCSPRAIYEGPIKEFFIEKNIPHRKSGPLNIAKATPGLDMTWAAQRRPSAIAKQVVKLVNYLEDSSEYSPQKIENVGISLVRRLVMESSRVESLSFEIEPTSNPDFLYTISRELINKAPDSGNTPQKLIAYLLKHYHQAKDTGLIVTGGDDRASVTSTTSNKPGDVNEESISGDIFKVYEVTVKPFDLARIRDSFDSILQYNEINQTDLNEIIVICREQDCPTDMKESTLSFYMGNYTYKVSVKQWTPSIKYPFLR